MIRRWFLLFAAWCAALLLLSLTLAAHASEYDVVGVGKSQSEMLLLQSVQGSCAKGGQRLILLIPRANQVYLGCWARKGEQVLLVFEDGDTLVLPAGEIKWLRPAPDA